MGTRRMILTVRDGVRSVSGSPEFLVRPHNDVKNLVLILASRCAVGDTYDLVILEGNKSG